MPYIKDEDDRRYSVVDDWSSQTPGELNYFITIAIKTYLHKKGESYTTYNDIIGVLECAKLEMYRRLVAPYEEIKRAENGDVY